jgi:hypothetical protein
VIGTYYHGNTSPHPLVPTINGKALWAVGHLYHATTRW